MKFLYLLTFLPLFALSQDQTEIPDIPKPYNPKPYFDQINNTNIKKVNIISKKKENNFRDDTSFVYEYNQLGQEVNSFRYEYNKRINKTEMKYDKNNNQTEWTILDRNDIVTTTKFYYNPFNKLDSTKQVSYRQGKITNTNRNSYTYEKGKLKWKQIISNDMVNRNDFYNYRDSVLIAYKSVSSPTGYFISNYNYDNNNQLIEKTTTHYFNTQTEFWNKKNFNYKNGKLISEEELTYDNKKIFTYYYYDNNDRLNRIKSIFGENDKEIEFDYNNNSSVDKITVNANSNSPYLKFYIPLRLDNVTFPIKYTETFIYDSKNNLINKKYFVGEELVQEGVYVIEYY